MKTIGIIGAGQLGLMLGAAANKLGFECVFLDPSEKPPAASVGPVIAAAFDDEQALATLADRCDVITYEFENVPVAAVRRIESKCPVLPLPDALDLARKDDDHVSCLRHPCSRGKATRAVGDDRTSNRRRATWGGTYDAGSRGSSARVRRDA